jgi:carbonic anhydrase
MKELFLYQSPTEHYVADAVLLCCLDWRVRGALEALIKYYGFSKVDVLGVAGGAKQIASPEKKADYDFAVSQIQACLRMHSCKEVVIINHRDCGAYGGSGKFSDPQEEMEFHKNELERARERLRNTIPADVEIKIVYMDFDKVYEI